MFEQTYASSLGDVSTISSARILDPMERLSEGAEPRLALLIEAIVSWSFAAFGQEEFVQAKKEFQLLTAPVFADDPFFHQWSCYFLDYFCFQRPTQGTLRENNVGSTPFISFLHSSALAKASEPLVAAFAALRNFRHSLYQVGRIKKNEMVLKDLLSLEKVVVVRGDLDSFLGFDRSCLLQGFVFPVNESLLLSPGVFLHPRGATRVVKKNLNKMRKEKTGDALGFLTRLAKQYLAAVRSKHVPPATIYK